MNAKKRQRNRPQAGDFAQRLHELRKQKNLSQSELGKLADIHYTHIGRYERGTSQPTAALLHRLADVLGVSGDYLMEGSTQDVAQARFKDRELLVKFQEVEKLPDDDKELVKRFLDAFLIKRKLQDLMAS